MLNKIPNSYFPIIKVVLSQTEFVKLQLLLKNFQKSKHFYILVIQLKIVAWSPRTLINVEGSCSETMQVQHIKM